MGGRVELPTRIFLTPFLHQHFQFNRILGGNFLFYTFLGCISTTLRHFYFYFYLVNQLIFHLLTMLQLWGAGCSVPPISKLIRSGSGFLVLFSDLGVIQARQKGPDFMVYFKLSMPCCAKN